MYVIVQFIFRRNEDELDGKRDKIGSNNKEINRRENLTKEVGPSPKMCEFQTTRQER